MYDDVMSDRLSCDPLYSIAALPSVITIVKKSVDQDLH